MEPHYFFLQHEVIANELSGSLPMMKPDAKKLLQFYFQLLTDLTQKSRAQDKFSISQCGIHISHCGIYISQCGLYISHCEIENI